MSDRFVSSRDPRNNRHINDKFYRLPQSDSQIYLDRPIKRRHVHVPDIDLPDLRNDRENKFERSKKFCRGILQAGQRKFSPNSLKAARILMDKIHDYNGRRKMGDPTEIEVFSNIMAQRYTELHGEEGICQKLIDQADSAIERRLWEEYGDYMAGNLAVLKQKCNQGFLVDPVWKQRNLDWQGVAKLIEDETNRTGDYKFAHNQADGFPLHSVRRDIHKAAEITGRKPKHLEWEILEYANRCKRVHSGAAKLAQMGKMVALAERWLTDWDEVTRLLSEDPARRDALYESMRIFKARYYVSLRWEEPKSDGFHMMLNEEGTRLNNKRDVELRGGGPWGLVGKLLACFIS
jgi:hypothetical protein